MAWDQGQVTGLGGPVAVPAHPRVRQLGRTIRAHLAGILAAIRLGPSNGRVEGVEQQDPLIIRRRFKIEM